eukprot:6491041-Amphidinium_carterae.1
MSSPAACDSRPSDIDSDPIDLLERMRTVARGTIQDDSPLVSRRSSCTEFEYAQDVDARTMTWHAIQNEYSLPDLEIEFWDAVFQEILACGGAGAKEKRKVYVDDEEDWEDACFQEYKLRELLEAVHWTGQPPSDTCLIGTSTNLLSDHVIKNAQDLEQLIRNHDDEGLPGDPPPLLRVLQQDDDEEDHDFEDLKERLRSFHPGLRYWKQWLSPPETFAWGGARSRSRSSHVRNGDTTLPIRIDSDTSGNDLVVSGIDIAIFCPLPQNGETLLACLQQVIWLENKKHLPHVHIRTVALLWTKQALKQGYMVAGTLIPNLAHTFNMTGEAFLEKYWDPSCPNNRAPPTLLVYAISCIYEIDIAVVDEQGNRTDGVIRPTRWRLKLVEEAYEIPSCQPERDPEVVGGARNLVRSRFGKLATSARHRYLESMRAERSVTLNVLKGADLHVAYRGTISSSSLLKEFAR